MDQISIRWTTGLQYCLARTVALQMVHTSVFHPKRMEALVKSHIPCMMTLAF